MAKTLVITNKTELQQKGWKLFAVIVVLQIIFLAVGYMISVS